MIRAAIPCVIFGFLFAHASKLWADDSPTDCPVAVVDLASLFHGSEELAARLGRLTAEAIANDKKLTEMRESVDKWRAELERLDPKSNSHAELAERIRRTDADWNLSRDKCRATLIRKEAVVYEWFFDEVDSEIDRLMHERNILIVVRSDGKRPSRYVGCPLTSTWEDCFMPSFRAVIRFNPLVDITKVIHDRLAEKHKHKATAGNGNWPLDANR